MNPAKLMMAVYGAYNQAIPQPDGSRGKWQPIMSNGQLVETFCNEAIQFVAQHAEGYHGFDGLRANAIYDVCVDTKDFYEIDPSQAQVYACQGMFVLAAWKNPDKDGHGHVCVIIPGELFSSESWNDICPIVMNIGKDVFIGKPASFAFSKANKPRYFISSKYK